MSTLGKQIVCVGRARLGREPETAPEHTPWPPLCQGAVQGAAQAAALRSPPLERGCEPQAPSLLLSQQDHHFNGGSAASLPRGASRPRRDRAREVEATDKAWEGRRKD